MITYESLTVRRAALYAAHRLAPAATAAELLVRLRIETLQALTAEHIAPPPELIETVLASGDRDLLVRLAGNRHLDEEAAVRMARRGDPAVGHALLTCRDHGERVRVAVWADADPASADWHTEVVTPLLEHTSPWLLRSALYAPFPELVRHAVRHLAPYLPSWIVVDRVLNICLARLRPVDARAELEACAELFHDEDHASHHPEPAAVFREAAAAHEPAAVLRAARARLGGHPRPRADHDAWLLGLRFGDRVEAPPGGVDWAAVLREDARLPYAIGPRIELTRHEGCPETLVFAAVRAGLDTSYAGRLRSVRPTAALPSDVLDDDPPTDLLVWGIDNDRLVLDEVLRVVTPASEVLAALHRLCPRPADSVPDDEDDDGSTRYRGPVPAALAPALARLIEPLGDDPEAWISLHHLVARFPGTCHELVAAAAAHADDERAKGAPVTWPRGLAARFPPDAPKGARAHLYALLNAAPEHVQCAVIPALDLRAVQHLTVYYPLSAKVRAHTYAVRGIEAAVANAAHWEMPADVVDGLLDLDDPEVNASLYDFGGIAQHERVRICAGRPRGGGSGRIPISPALGDLLARTSAATRRNWLLAALDSGDPMLVRAMLGRTRLNTEVGRLRVAVGLWERHGPDAVASLLDETRYPGRRPGAKHPFPATTHRTLRTALAAPPEAGLASVREILAAARTPDAAAGYILRAGRSDERLEHFEAEYGITVPWDLLIAADDRQPLSEDLSAALATHPDCPRRLLTAYLARIDFPLGVHEPDWLPSALDDGRLVPADLLTLAAPAGNALAHLGGTDLPFTEDLTRLVAETDFDPARAEHWTVAIRLFPEFTGTLPELLATTASALR
ncbi:hypothetical protein [Embleya hyalina]|uniref:Uncharacterized protein n=1 Tax=Embleya hyalina TaxID=516124 RepID=A0A401YN67_9ACTN|nr:hypothetical protein [Embleya hyalina]GCD96017.1 hypothetical protein EHYA_03701 [Embleya hyalina]